MTQSKFVFPTACTYVAVDKNTISPEILLVQILMILFQQDDKLSEGFSAGAAMRNFGFSGSSVLKTGLARQICFHMLEPENPTFLSKINVGGI